MNNTIFVLLDACRYDLGTRNLGFLEHMVDYGKGAKFRVRGELPSLSRPIYATLLNGLPVHRHGVSSNDMICRLTTENVFSLCQAHNGLTAAAAYSWFSELFCCAPFHRPKDRIRLGARGDIDYGIFYWEDSYPDSHLFADGEYLRRQYDPDFILYHTMGIDWAGHMHGASSAEYEQAILAADACLSQLLPLWLAEEYQVVITSDVGLSCAVSWKENDHFTG